MTEQIALRFPDGTKDRIRSFARSGETMTATVLRALECLAMTGDSPIMTAPDLDLRREVSDLAERVAFLESLAGRTKNPERAQTVERIQRMRATGISCQTIADALNREGVPTLSGRGQWQPGTVQKLTQGATDSHGSPEPESD
jgi:hypothetical protein